MATGKLKRRLDAMRRRYNLVNAKAAMLRQELRRLEGETREALRREFGEVLREPETLQ